MNSLLNRFGNSFLNQMSSTATPMQQPNILESFPEIANTLYMLSLEEMKHMALLHEQVVKIIDEYRKTNGNPPAAMQAIYDFLHEKFMRETKEIKIMQNMYVEK